MLDGRRPGRGLGARGRRAHHGGHTTTREDAAPAALEGGARCAPATAGPDFPPRTFARILPRSPGGPFGPSPRNPSSAAIGTQDRLRPGRWMPSARHPSAGQSDNRLKGLLRGKCQTPGASNAGRLLRPAPAGNRLRGELGRDVHQVLRLGERLRRQLRDQQRWLQRHERLEARVRPQARPVGDQRLVLQDDPAGRPLRLHARGLDQEHRRGRIRPDRVSGRLLRHVRGAEELHPERPAVRGWHHHPAGHTSSRHASACDSASGHAPRNGWSRREVREDR